MATCTAVNGAGHRCSWPLGHTKHGFIGIGPTPAYPTPAVPVHGYYNPQGFWEIWIVAPAPPAKGAS